MAWIWLWLCATFGGWALWPLIKQGQIKTSMLLLLFAAGLYIQLGGLKQSLEEHAIQQKAAELAGKLNQENGVEALISSLKQIAESRQNDAQAWYWLGRMHMRAGQTKKAKLALIKAHKLAPEAAVVTFHYAMAITADNQGKCNKQCIDLLKKIDKDPQLKPVVDLWLQRVIQ